MSTKLTKQRKRILDLIQTSTGHMTADEIHSKLKDEGVSMGIATIYRNLNVLYAEKQINRMKHPELGFIYDKNLHRHYHFRCRSCNKIEDVELPYQEELHLQAEAHIGGRVTHHELMFEGLCADCLEKQRL